MKPMDAQGFFITIAHEEHSHPMDVVERYKKIYGIEDLEELAQQVQKDFYPDFYEGSNSSSNSVPTGAELAEKVRRAAESASVVHHKWDEEEIKSLNEDMVRVNRGQKPHNPNFERDMAAYDRYRKAKSYLKKGLGLAYVEPQTKKVDKATALRQDMIREGRGEQSHDPNYEQDKLRYERKMQTVSRYNEDVASRTPEVDKATALRQDMIREARGEQPNNPNYAQDKLQLKRRAQTESSYNKDVTARTPEVDRATALRQDMIRKARGEQPLNPNFEQDWAAYQQQVRQTEHKLKLRH